MKTVKRFLADCMGPGCRLDTDQFSIVILQYKNIPCRFLGLFPSQILYAGNLYDRVVVNPEQLQLRT